MSDMNEQNKGVIKEFRENAGNVGGFFEGANMILVHTTGAKSGKERINPLMYFADGARYAIFASKGGAPTNPDWYYNIVANPEIRVEVGSETFEVTATVAEEPERTEIYGKMAAMHSNFADYEKGTTRVIPVVILTRRP
jgi:deazaflavin-dependent oxidoreductase (nitroreductase family)